MGMPVLAEVETTLGNRILLIHAYTSEPPMFAVMSNEHGIGDNAGGYDSHVMNYVRRTDFLSVVTILPALPRHPKPEHAPLLYRYMAEGLEVCGGNYGYVERYSYNLDGLLRAIHGHVDTEITHAIYNGERVEIAIVGVI